MSAVNYLRDPLLSRGLAASEAERAEKGLGGFMPAAVRSFTEQEDCAIAQLRKKATPLDKYEYIQRIQNIDERLYYALLARFTEECLPLVYTPTVGAACLAWSDLYTSAPRGIYLSLKDKGRVGEILASWPQRELIKAIVFTDGERILGLGDLGANGMGIPVGKLALYTACAGVDPAGCLPVHLDAGTNNAKLLADPFYVGLRQERDGGQAYDDLVEEFIVGAQAAFGENVLLQFEDFGNKNAFRLLERYQPRCCTFNDDIQGTASVALAGLVASGRLSGRKLQDEVFVFLGAGEAGVGIADLVALAISKETGVAVEEARKKIFLLDSRGLVTSAREDKLAHHKLPYAHAPPPPAVGDFGSDKLLAAVEAVKPTCLIGVSAVPQSFSEKTIQALCRHTPNSPVVMALSNPTSQAECTAEQAYAYSKGACIFASGSPFDPVALPDGSMRVPGQGNNAYIFPAVGLAAVGVQAKHLTDDDMYVAAKALAELVTPERLAVGCVYPPLSEIREVSAIVAGAVAENIYARGDALLAPKPADLVAHCRSCMYDPLASSKL